MNYICFNAALSQPSRKPKPVASRLEGERDPLDPPLFDAAIEEENKAIDAGLKAFFIYVRLATAHALRGDIDEAKTAMAEARRLHTPMRYPDSAR